MSTKQTGIVKWLDNDGCGYVTLPGAPKVSYLFDGSVTLAPVQGGQAVQFEIVNVLGRECAVNVEPLT
jgi:cold shock CspA family protein